MTQRQVADAAGVDRSTVIRIEAGSLPSLRTANAIAHALRVDRDVLFDEIAPKVLPGKPTSASTSDSCA